MARVASVVRFWLLVTVGFEVLALIRSFWLREPIHEVQPMYALVGADMRPERRHFEFITAALLLIRLSSLIRPHSSGAWLTTAVSHIVEAGFFTWLIFGSNPSNRTAKMSLTPWDPKTQGFVIYGIVIANALTFAFTWLCCSPDTLTAAGPKIKRSFGVVILQLWLLCTIGVEVVSTARIAGWLPEAAGGSAKPAPVTEAMPIYAVSQRSNTTNAPHFLFILALLVSTRLGGLLHSQDAGAWFSLATVHVAEAALFTAVLLAGAPSKAIADAFHSGGAGAVIPAVQRVVADLAARKHGVNALGLTAAVWFNAGIFWARASLLRRRERAASRDAAVAAGAGGAPPKEHDE